MANGGRVFLLALLGWIGFASPAFAHHGYAAYDMTQTLTLREPLRKWSWPTGSPRWPSM